MIVLSGDILDSFIGSAAVAALGPCSLSLNDVLTLSCVMCAGLIVFCVGLDASMGGGDVPDAETLQVRKRWWFWTTCQFKRIILPRQARDKHSESTKKDGRFLADALASLLRAHSRPYDGGACCVVSVVVFELQFYHG